MLGLENVLKVKDKWNKLKAQYFREKKKEEKPKTGSGLREKYIFKWFLMNKMSFLSGSRDVTNNLSDDTITSSVIQQVMCDFCE